MKRLVFFARDLRLGGLERALVRLLNALAPRYRVTLVLEARRGELLGELDGRVRVRVIAPCRLAFRPLRRAINAARTALWALESRRGFDFACAYATDSVFGSRLARLASQNACLYVHNDYARILPEPERFADFFRALGAERFRHLVFVSNESREGFLARCPSLTGRTRVIGNLIGGGRLRALAAEPCPYRRGEGETVFLYLGRLEEEQKRPSRLLAAFALASKRRADFRLLLVGDGPARPACERAIREHGLEGRALLCGAYENPYPFLAAADCLVLASDFEGFPLVCYEAMALGIDIITTVPVSDELTDLRGWATVCERSAESLAAAMTAYRPHRRPPLDADLLDRERLRELEALF